MNESKNGSDIRIFPLPLVDGMLLLCFEKFWVKPHGEHRGRLPDRLDPCRLNPLVAGDERQAEVKGRSRNDTVGHVGDNIAGHSVNGLSHVRIDWRDE